MIATTAPASATAKHKDNPIPRAPPVTMITLSFKDNKSKTLFVKKAVFALSSPFVLDDIVKTVGY